MVRQKDKESKIEPMKVLVKTGGKSSFGYEPYTIIALRYKRKNKPDIITESGEKIDRYWIRDILLDTPETREALEKAQELSRKIAELQLEISSAMSVSSKVDLENLHRRIKNE